LGTCYDVDSGGAGGDMHSNANHIYVTGFFVNYIAEIVDATDTVTSHSDDITAADEFTGAGTFKYASSFANGAWNVSDSLRVGDATNNITIGSDGSAILNGTARIIKIVNIFPLLIDETGGGSAGRGIINATPVILYGASSDDYSNITMPLPLDADLTVDPILRIHAVPVDTQSLGSDFYWTANIRYISLGGALDKIVDETTHVVQTISNTALIYGYADITLDRTLMTAGDLIAVNFYREGTNILDDRNGDAALIGMGLRYTSNKL
jgi:hypothetical protein